MRRSAIVAGLALAACLLLGVAVTWLGTPDFDVRLVADARGGRDGAFGALMRACSRIGYAPLLLPIALAGAGLAAILRRSVTTAAPIVLAPLVAMLLNAGVLKPLFGRERPLDRIDALGASLAMPSGHAAATAALAVAGVAAMPTTRLRVAAALLLGAFAAATGVSRVVLGAHFPTDVLAGWCEGIAVGIGVVGAAGLVRARAR